LITRECRYSYDNGVLALIPRRYPESSVYFVNGASKTSLKDDFEAIIRSQGAEYRLKTFDDAIIWLSSKSKPWLMIIDNVDDPSINIFPMIPKARHGHVIITSRDSTRLGLARPGNRHSVGDLDQRASIELLLQLSSYPSNGVNRMLASQIATELGCLPLALAHAGAYISIHGSLSSYLEMYRQSQKEMMEEQPPNLPSEYDLAVAATIEVSVAQLPQQTRDILELLSHFHTASIAEEIIVRAAKRKFAHVAQYSAISPPAEMGTYADALMKIFCPNSRWSQHEFDRLIHPCLQYSLLQSGKSKKMGRYLTMHPLVQSWLRLQPEQRVGPSKQDLIIRLLGSSVTIGEDYEYLEFNRELRQHIQSLNEKDVKHIGDKHAFQYVLHENGDFSRALDFLESCIEEERTLLGEEHPDTMKSMLDISIRYLELGRHTEALEIGIKSMEHRQKIMGEEHPETLRSMHILSMHYSQVGRHDEALEMAVKTLEIRQKILGDEHPDTLRSTHNLSIRFSQVGRHTEALEKGVKAMRLYQKVLGTGHPTTLASMYTVSSCYCGVGRYAEALRMGLKVINLQQKTIGNEHPGTLRSMDGVSIYYSKLGRYGEALKMGVKAMELRQKVLGDEHPDVLRSMYNASICYSRVGRHVEALEIGLKVMEHHQKILGSEHLDTLRSMHIVSVSSYAIGRYAEALEIGLKVLRLYQSTLGKKRLDTLRPMDNASIYYSQAGTYAKALEIGLKTMRLLQRVLGNEHTDTLHSMDNVSACYYS
jgi:tetratricopeptide (TPR) repeat protein